MKKRYRTATVFMDGKTVDACQLEEKLVFKKDADEIFISAHPDGDHVLITEQWFYPDEAYDEILSRWPYPKEAHKFPKGWVEARRLCIEVVADNRPYILYINRDAYTDQLVLARLNR